MTRSSEHTTPLRWLPESLPGRFVLGFFLCAGTFLRLVDVGPALLFGDELHSLGDMQGGYGHILSHFSPTGGGLALPLIQRILMDLFGDGHWSLRAPAWLGGLALLYLSFPIGRRHFGESAAGVATALVAVAPILIFYAHFARIYSLVAVLCLLLYDELSRYVQTANDHADGSVQGKVPRPQTGLGLILITAALPWAHPTALGFVLPVYAGALLACALGPRPSRERFIRLAWPLVRALSVGGLICALTYWPARESLLAFLGEKTRAEYYGDFGILDVASLIAGSRSAAIGLGILAVVGAIAALRKPGHRHGLLLFAALGPALTIALIRPYGDAYAYARYVMPGVVPFCGLVGLGLSRIGERIPGLGSGSITLLGGAIALALGLTGPMGPGQPRIPEHANTYLSMLGLSAFDMAWPGTPNFYRTLGAQAESEGAGQRLIEVPALTTRARHLYRHYQIQHGASSLVAPLPGEFPRISSGPYVSFQRPNWQEEAQADYLVVHLDIAQEIADYWRWLYGPEGPGPFAPEEAAFMERHRVYGGLLPRPNPATLAALQAQLGEPLISDERLRVWKLRRTPSSSD